MNRSMNRLELQKSPNQSEMMRKKLEQIPKDHDMIEPQRHEELPSEMISCKRRPAWAHEIIEEAKRYGVPKGTIRESKKPKPYPSYVALM